jgi:hypothetical protein
MPRGSGAPMLMLQGSSALMTSSGSSEAKTTAQGAYLAQDLSARLGRDGGWLLGLERLLVLLRPLRWGFSRCARCRISPSVGYPGILMLDRSIEESMRRDYGTCKT